MKKVISVKQIKEADLFTIEHEPISSLLLMERAAKACFNWIRHRYAVDVEVSIFCGTGNNGGDGLVIADYLLAQQNNVRVFILKSSKSYSPDFIENEKRLLRSYPNHVFNVYNILDFPHIDTNNLVIDAIFGTGLNKNITGLSADLIKHINDSKANVVSIDIPSGLFADSCSDKNAAIIKASHTLTFQLKKIAFYFPFSNEYTGEVHVMDIKLLPQYFNSCKGSFFETEEADITQLLKSRAAFSHKGIFGHALMMCGSYGKMGAAVLSTQACLRSGVGLVTANIPKCGYEIMQTALPEAMVITDNADNILTHPIPYDAYNAIGIGCGMGTNSETISLLSQVLESKLPLVIDADAINCISLDKQLLKKLNPNTILTPHFKEFERMTMKAKDDLHRNQLQQEFSIKNNCFVVLKGRFTCISTPEGKCYFNPTGNAGMATAGSGDVLTGILTGLLAQGYTTFETCLIGVYLHGMAGDFAAAALSKSYMNASDITIHLANVFKHFEGDLTQ